MTVLVSRVPFTGWVRRCAIGVAAALVLASASGVAAQAPPATVGTTSTPTLTAPDSTWLVQDPAAQRCLDTLSAASLRPVTVYQVAHPSETDPDVLAQVALISQQIAEGVRSALASGPNAVPGADTLVAWRRLAGRIPIRIVVRRDAATTWSIDGTADTAKAKVTALYASVLQAMPGDQLWMVWPPHLSSDSVVVFLDLTSSEASAKPLALPGYPLMSVFLARGVGFTPAMALRDNPVPTYPLDAEEEGIGVEVVLRFVIGINGVADASTVSVVAPSKAALDDRRSGRYAREFVSATEQTVRRMRFRPARAGGCAVPQLVTFPFTFVRK